MLGRALRALTVRQPWAWAIFHAGKAVENRTRRTCHRGPLLIHAGLSRAELPNPAAFRARYGVDAPDPAGLPFGAVIGVVDVVGCVRAGGGSLWADPETSGPWASGPWCWILAHPVAFAEPVPFVGALGLFDVPAGRVPEFDAVRPSERR